MIYSECRDVMQSGPLMAWGLPLWARARGELRKQTLEDSEPTACVFPLSEHGQYINIYIYQWVQIKLVELVDAPKQGKPIASDWLGAPQFGWGLKLFIPSLLWTMDFTKSIFGDRLDTPTRLIWLSVNILKAQLVNLMLSWRWENEGSSILPWCSQTR